MDAVLTNAEPRPGPLGAEQFEAALASSAPTVTATKNPRRALGRRDCASSGAYEAQQNLAQDAEVAAKNCIIGGS